MKQIENMPVNQPELQNHSWFTIAVANLREELPNFKIINVWGPNMSCFIKNQVTFFRDISPRFGATNGNESLKEFSRDRGAHFRLGGG